MTAFEYTLSSCNVIPGETMKRNVFVWRISQFAGTQRHTTAKLREATITHASQASFSVGIPLTVNRVYTCSASTHPCITYVPIFYLFKIYTYIFVLIISIIFEF